MKSPEHVHDIALADNARSRSSAAPTPVSLAHGINHAPGALKPLVFPSCCAISTLAGELGIIAWSDKRRRRLLQLGAGALGRILPRRQILGIGHASVGGCFIFVGLAQSYFSVLLLDGYVDCRRRRSQSSLRNRTSVKQNPAIFNVRRDRFACEFHL